MLAYMQAEAVSKGYPSLGLPFGKTVIFTQVGINLSVIVSTAPSDDT